VEHCDRQLGRFIQTETPDLMKGIPDFCNESIRARLPPEMLLLESIS
jgi:hypothetical protein